MRTQLLSILSVLLFVSCVGGNRKGTEAEIASGLSEDTDFFVFNLERGFAEGPKATVLNELIDSIFYIPLETNENVLLPGDRHTLAKIKSDIFISGGSPSRPAPIYRFDSLGRFKEQVTHIGRGPNETIMPMWWYSNSNLEQINVVDMALKMIIVHTDHSEKSNVAVNMSQGLQIVPLNDGMFVSAGTLNSQNVPNTYLYFFNQTGKMLHSIERNDELSNYNLSMSERVQAPPYEGYLLWSDYTGDAIFHDIFNDTLYRIKSYREILPHLVFKRGALMPDPKDTHNLENKKRQAYISGLIESGDHVFISYTIGDETWRDVWSKRDGGMMLHMVPRRGYPFDLFVPYALSDGSVVELQVVYADRDYIYCVLEAFVACKFLPGVKEEDNPVVVVAKLKPQGI